MTRALMNGVAAAGSGRRHGFWRKALSGLTPQIVAIVAVMLFLSILSAKVN
jgi:hypothetical protein